MPIPRLGSEPVLPAHDLARTRGFYESLGFIAGYNDDRYDILRQGDLTIHLELQDDLVPERNRTSCYWRVADADALHAEFAAAGIRSLTDPCDEPWGMREFTLKDPSGNLLRVGHVLATARERQIPRRSPRGQ